MKKLAVIFGLFLISILITSCGNVDYQREYQLSENGKVYYYGTDKLYTGTIIDTANVIIQFEVVKGIKHGEFKTSYLDGTTEKLGYINKNKNEGEWKYYYQNGQLESVGCFADNIPAGEWISYYSNGQIKAMGSYLNGKQHGRWTYFKLTGEVINIQFFQEGQLKDTFIKFI